MRMSYWERLNEERKQQKILNRIRNIKIATGAFSAIATLALAYGTVRGCSKIPQSNLDTTLDLEPIKLEQIEDSLKENQFYQFNVHDPVDEFGGDEKEAAEGLELRGGRWNSPTNTPTREYERRKGIPTNKPPRTKYAQIRLPNTRGVRNNNPGNIRHDPNEFYAGQTGVDKDGFRIFKTPAYGIRAMMIKLQKYDSEHGLNTIEAIISRWAPPVENDTAKYIHFVAKRTGFNPNQKLDLYDLQTLVELTNAIAKMDSGAVYHPDVVEQAYKSLNLNEAYKRRSLLEQKVRNSKI